MPSFDSFSLFTISWLLSATVVVAQTPIPSELPSSVTGVWRQREDGRYLKVTASHADFFDCTASICYRATPDSGKPLSKTYALYAVANDGRELHLWRDDYGDRFERFYREEFERVDQLPNAAVQEAELDPRFQQPEFIASLIVQHLDEHFPFFDRRQFDWESRRQALLDTVNDRTTDAELYAALCASLDGLGDSHTRIYWTKKTDGPFKSGKNRVLTFLASARHQQTEYESLSAFAGHWQRTMRAKIAGMMRDGKVQFAANDRLRWGFLPNNIGYLESEFLNGFGAAKTSRPHQLDQLSTELDRILMALKDCRALILDLSYNAGGYDAAALTIASRFADRRRHVMSYHAAGRDSNDVRKCYVSPAGRTFTKPVYVLTSHSTVSAGETLTMAMKAFPHVRHVGEPTRGCASSFLNKWMPNDFHLTLSNEIWTLPDGTLVEGTGVVPDQQYSVFAEDEIFSSYPRALQRTIDVVNEHAHGRKRVH